MTGRELAAKAGLWNINVSRYEAGGNEPSVAMADKLAAALGVALDELMRDGEDNAAPSPTLATPKFAACLRSLRVVRGLNVAALAKASGIDATQLGRYESGTREPLLSSASRLADALGVTLDQLAGRNP